MKCLKVKLLSPHPIHSRRSVSNIHRRIFRKLNKKAKIFQMKKNLFKNFPRKKDLTYFCFPRTFVVFDLIFLFAKQMTFSREIIRLNFCTYSDWGNGLTSEFMVSIFTKSIPFYIFIIFHTLYLCSTKLLF